MPVVQPYTTISNRDLTDCASKSRIFRYQVDLHNDKRIHYEFIVYDFTGSTSTVRLIIVPEESEGPPPDPDPESACMPYGSESTWCYWNNNLYNPRWNCTFRESYTNYCDDVRIKKISFDIFSDCDSVITTEWHIRIGSQTYNNLYDSNDNDTIVSCEFEILTPLDEWPIEIWCDQFVLDDYSYPNCGTVELPSILLKVRLED